MLTVPTAVGISWGIIPGCGYKRQKGDLLRDLLVNFDKLERLFLLGDYGLKVGVFLWSFKGDLIDDRVWRRKTPILSPSLVFHRQELVEEKKRCSTPKTHYWQSFYHVLLSWAVIQYLHFEHLHFDSLSIIWYSNIGETFGKPEIRF